MKTKAKSIFKTFTDTDLGKERVLWARREELSDILRWHTTARKSIVNTHMHQLCYWHRLHATSQLEEELRIDGEVCHERAGETKRN